MNARLCDICLADGKLALAAGNWGRPGLRLHVCATCSKKVPTSLPGPNGLLDYVSDVLRRVSTQVAAMNLANRAALRARA